MLQIQSTLAGIEIQFSKVEEKLKQEGWVIGGNWEYNQGCFDYVYEKQPSYRIVRLPFQALVGNLDGGNPTIKFQTPFVLVHSYQDSLDDQVQVGVFSSLINQFSEPLDKDAPVYQEDVEIGGKIIRRIESILLQ